MDKIDLFAAIGEVPDDMLMDVENIMKQQRVRHHVVKRIVTVAAAAACLSLAVFAGYQVFQPLEEAEQGETSEAVIQLGVTIDGSTEQYSVVAASAVHVYYDDSSVIYIDQESSDVMSIEEAEQYAGLALDSATEEEQELILAAREVIINSQSWAADGLTVTVTEEDGIEYTLPSFSELFPDWDMPTTDTTEWTFTEDGLSASGLYGVSAEILECYDTYLICQVSADSCPFEEGREIRVYISSDLEDTVLQTGEEIFISFYGMDCDGTEGTITAYSLSLE